VPNPSKLVYRNPDYDGQLVRTVAAAPVHSSDLGEALETARSIKRLNASAWHGAWSATADDARRDAESSFAEGDVASAQHGYLRASEYFRQSYYFIRSNLDDSRLHESYREHVRSFEAAIALMDIRAERVTIPYQGTSLLGYLFAPDDRGTKRPTVLFPCGYDSTAQAGWVNVPAALERGYNALVFEGPGQGDALFTQRLFFRPDFESVCTPVIDWLLTRDDIDPASLILIGRSFAGYLAPRAAAFEHRLAALVVDPAQPNLGDRLPSGIAAKAAGPVVRMQMRLSENRREFFAARMAAHGIEDIGAYFAELRRYNMLDVAKEISCPTLIIECENDFAGGSGQALKDAMSAPTDLVRLDASQGADGHCAGLGQEIWSETVYGWLTRVLKNSR
jgi:pimeloyl-ACP methyl ester carboxylesterase